MFPKSLLQIISQRISDEVMALNLLQVMPKEMMESIGRSWRMDNMWSWAIWVIEDLLLLLIFAMEMEQGLVVVVAAVFAALLLLDE